MQNSDLALLNRAVDATVNRELGNPTDNDPQLVELFGLGTSQRTRSVSGLTVTSVAARDADLHTGSAQMTDRLLGYLGNAQVVRDKLERQGVTPVAVLPMNAWMALCDRTRLFRFTPVDDTVRIETDSIITTAKARVDAELDATSGPRFWRLAKIYGSILVTCLVLIILRVSPLTVPHSGFGIPIGIMTAIFWALRAGIMSDNVRTPLDREQRDAVAIRAVVAELLADGSLFAKLWPNYREPDKGDVRVHLALPEPPVDVVDTLLRAERARLPLRLAVVGEAVGIRDDLPAVLIRENNRQLADLRMLASLDPIVYVVEGAAVAILAQYGEFPIEKAVMKEVISSVYLV